METDDARAFVQAIKMRQLGRLHAEKTKLPMVKLTRALMTGLTHQISYHSDKCTYWRRNTPINTKVGAGSVIVGDASGFATPWDRKSNTTTSYTQRRLSFKGDFPCDEWALVDAIVHEYEADNNKTGGLVIATPGNDEMSFSAMAQDDVTWTVLGYPAYVNYVFKHNMAFATMCKYDNSVDSQADALAYYDIMPLDDERYYKSGITKDEFDEWEDLAYRTYFREQYTGKESDVAFSGGRIVRSPK